MQDKKNALSWFAYHKDYKPMLVYSEEEYLHLLSKGWVDSPAKVNEVSEEIKKDDDSIKHNRKSVSPRKISSGTTTD